MLPSVIAGFGLGLSLIVAIGAQNLFVLRQGIRREHVLSTRETMRLGLGASRVASQRSPPVSR